MSETLYQATCVALDGRGLLILGEPGTGKTSLALALIDRGAQLVGDDGVALEMREGTLWACPPQATAGLVEIRNVGIATLPATPAPVALAVTLDSSAPRLPEKLGELVLHDQTIPHLALYPGAEALALRAEYALRLHGLA